MDQESTAPFSPGAAVARWRPQSFDRSAAAIDLIDAEDVRPILPDVDLWDYWPLAHRDGRTVSIDGTSFWFFLSAPRFDDPGQRHDSARIRLVGRSGDRWTDLGSVIPREWSPGSREWAGSALLDDDGSSATLFFTAAGRIDAAGSFEQRLFEMRGKFDGSALCDWTPPVECVVSDGNRYTAARELAGVPGAIKAFRDPAFFHDPLTGQIISSSPRAPAGMPTPTTASSVARLACRGAGSWTIR